MDPENKVEDLRTSEEWSKLPSEQRITIVDPDGWDRNNFHYSWYEEKISHKTYEFRKMQSTLRIKKSTVSW
jgi:hypothetical protein